MDRRFALLAGCLLLSALTLGTHAKASASLPDLGIHLISMDPLIAEIPAESLVPVLEEKVAKALLPIDEHTQKVRTDEVHLTLVEGGIQIRAKGKAALRYCGPRPWPLHGEFCTPWVEDVFRARVDLSLSVENWLLTARHQYTDIELANDALDAIKRALTADFYRPINAGIDEALREINGQDLRSELERALELTIDPESSASATIAPAALRIEIVH